MSRTPPRRAALRGLAAVGTAVIGFDPFTRSWAATASGRPLHDIPELDGSLSTDEVSLNAAADDFGHLVHRRPAAVLRPGSVRDVVTMVRFCAEHRVPVAPRGQGHGTNGQAQAEGGLVVETTPLAAVQPVGPRSTSVRVGAGARWSEVAKATLAHGLTPPVFTDYLELSVGGTLSVGGLGGQAHRYGAQVDTVLELEVVTGAGELTHCSPTRHRDLFHAVLAGLGQCAVIVGATVRLVRAPGNVRHYLLPYSDLRTFLDDQRLLVEQRRFDYVEGLISEDASGAFRGYALEAVAYGPPVGDAPDDTALLRGLRYDPSGTEITDLTYYDFLDRLAPGVAALKEAGLWEYAHPWLDVLLPGRAAADLAGRILGELTPADLGPGGVVLLYPLVRERLRTPLLRMPDDPVPYLLAVLRTTPPGDTATVQRLLAANRAAYELVRAAGGTWYPTGSVPFDEADWRRHFGPAWPRLAAAKRTYDPHGILVPGQGIF
ncbi:FAD-binding protein [Streptomyces sp. LRE541]|uniref:FAD-binding protein n=1 Tax=Streptomyces sp. LRE541 TaxID=2931983 RepID=UPI00200F2073|nr:FAD-binding protein [Streptomyces sp. LRE541]UPZ27217.1 FAD-binding protein [Streptomyces sp. LRE541]